jgi:voltage-gated potassium channel Kch
VVIVILARLLLFAPALLAAKQGPVIALAASINLAQISEFSLLLIPVGVAQGALSRSDVGAINYAMMLSVLLSTYAIRYNYDVALLQNHGAIRAAGMRVVYGDISNPETLRHCGIDRARVVLSTLNDTFLRGITTSDLLGLVRRINPEARFIATAVSAREATELETKGPGCASLRRRRQLRLACGPFGPLWSDSEARALRPSSGPKRHGVSVASGLVSLAAAAEPGGVGGCSAHWNLLMSP